MNRVTRKTCLFVVTVLLYFSSGAIAADQLIISDPSDYDYFGTAVGVDGNLAVVGAPNHDTVAYATRASRVYIFHKTGDVWVESDTLVNPNDSFEERYGTSVAVSGDTIIVGAYETDVTIGEDVFIRAGAVYIYSPDGSGGWNVQKIIAPDSGATYNFGFSVDIDGDIAVVGAPRNRPGTFEEMNGAAYVFYRAGGVWSLVKKNHRFGSAACIVRKLRVS